MTAPMWECGPVKVLLGDARARLADLPTESVHCVVTSPPYWGLRDYNAPGQLGLEATPEEYVCRLAGMFAEVRRVLRPDGTCWLNLGDSYASNVKGSGGSGKSRLGPNGDLQNIDFQKMEPRRFAHGLKAKDLVGIPWRVALALQADGWYLRSDMIWSKPNPMPESVTDRPTRSHEYVFLLTRSDRYFYDADAVREPAVEPPGGNRGGSLTRFGRDEALVSGEAHRGNAPWVSDGGRNLRSVWSIATQPYSEAHFATFPEELARRCVAAGTSERGCCPECGAPWRRVTERAGTGRVYDRGACAADHRAVGAPQRTGSGSGALSVTATTIGWEPTCAHGRGPVQCVVLDPFAGSGTTLAVARQMGRRAVGVELQADYLPMIQRRVEGAALPLLELSRPEATG